YTNSGKTSLVKCLTGAASLDPKDRLFATLDTTRHSARGIPELSSDNVFNHKFRLPSGRKVVFTDTIGFLSDLPMHLLAAFQATLSHVTLADVIIHIRDLSNPDWPAQSEDVEKTLEQIGLPPDRLNDIDVEGTPSTSSSGAVRISCKTSEGIEGLIEKVDKMVLQTTGCDSFVDFAKVRVAASFLTVQPALSLEIKCNMVGVTDFTPSDPENHRWFLKFRCMNCGESRDYWQYVVINEVLEVPGSRGEANLVEKCKLCNRVNTVAIIQDSIGKYDAAEHNEEWQSMIQLDCRGLEPIDFDPRMGWTAVGTESGTVFDDIDLSEKAWADYDEKVGEATEIGDFEVRFVHAKQK
ncbi:hypothetical protein OSTOST_07588, partial [Ostertagia ostertagi]